MYYSELQYLLFEINNLIAYIKKKGNWGYFTFPFHNYQDMKRKG